MRHLINNIKTSNRKIIAQFQVGNSIYDLYSFGKNTNVSVDGHEIINGISGGQNFDKIAHLIKDLISNGIVDQTSPSIQAYKCAESKISETIFDTLKKDLDSSVKLVLQAKELPYSNPIKFNIDEAFSSDCFNRKLKEFAQTLHDINETLRVCREDILSLSNSRLINTMWGAKPTQLVMNNIFSSVAENDEWEKLEFYTNIILKSIDRLTRKLNSSFFNVCDEEKKVVNAVLIPNILQNFERIKSIVSTVLMMLSNFVYIDEVFKKNTSFPATWFINGTTFEDLKLDYKNLVLFALKIPRYEQEIIYPLDMMKHSFINKE